MRYSRLTALILAAALTFSLALPVHAAAEDEWLIAKVKDTPSFTDTVGSWCQSEVETVYEAGLMDGRSATRFAAADPLTNAQVIVVAARTYTALAHEEPLPEPEAGPSWYQPAYNRLSALEGKTGGNRLLNPSVLQESANEPCTRSTFAKLLLLALEGAGVTLPVRNDLTTAVPDLNPANEIYTLYRAGILTGTDSYGTFRASGTLNRGQAAAMLARLIDPSLRRTFTPKVLDACRDILGLDPYAAALTINGMSVRADVVTPIICDLLENRYNQMVSDGPSANHLDTVLTEAAASIQEDLALERLAAERGITVTEEDLAKEYPPMVSGYRGLSEAAQRWENTHAFMKSRLLEQYNQQYGSENWGSSPSGPAETPGSIRLQSDLAALESAMTVTVLESLRSLDLSAAQTRLVQSPLFNN